MPLNVAYSRTIHRFQGLSAGPVDKNRIPNAYSAVVCDPGPSSFEARHPGLLYTAVSRGTTLGDKEGRNSAVYFTGMHMLNDARIRGISTKENGEEYDIIKYRRKWTQRIKRNTKRSTIGKRRQTKLFQWSKTATISIDNLHDHVKEYIKYI